MKKSTTFVSRTVAGMLLLLVLSVPSLADNTKTTVDQVNDEVTISNDVDYIVNSATPFGTNGKVNIANTEHAVLIYQSYIYFRDNAFMVNKFQGLPPSVLL